MNPVKTITPPEAWQMVQDHPTALLIDIRSQMEFLFVGHPTGAIHMSPQAMRSTSLPIADINSLEVEPL